MKYTLQVDSYPIDTTGANGFSPVSVAATWGVVGAGDEALENNINLTYNLLQAYLPTWL